MIFGLFFVRPIPLPPIDPVPALERGTGDSPENRALLSQDDLTDGSRHQE